ncbi:MAG TPA: epoxide hydrolase [Acidimicrobiales bacterium]|jgi:pimeloyl-ACP methyl ester carboxylesterase|nr:epoxide hydrolase [Acidimicrobiales bacterium]
MTGGRDPVPFTVVVTDEAIADLHRRLDHTRLAPSLPGDGWTLGTSAGYLAELVFYWRHHYDWRFHEQQINRADNYRVEIDGVPLHFLRAPGRGPDPLPLVLTHGWPWTFWDFAKVIGPLSDPVAHGGDEADAFDVVVPSLPGYGFSTPLPRTGISFTTTADLWARLMTEVLGYPRFVAHGSDFGMFVAAQLGHKYAGQVAGIHLAGPVDLDGWRPTETYHPWSDYIRRAEGSTDPERRADYPAWERVRASHLAVHMGEPQTLAHGLHDSPAGLASWLVHRRYAWGDCGDDIESRFSKDELLTNVSIYWFTETLWSSIRFYAAAVDVPWAPSHPRLPVVEVPTALSLSRPDRPPGYDPDRSDLASRFDLSLLRLHDVGGHFGPMEEPERFVDDLRDAFRPLRD